MAFVCTLDAAQKDLLFTKVSTDLIAMSKAKDKFILSDYVNNFYNEMVDSGVDQPTAVAYAALIPSNLKLLIGLDPLVDDLIAPEVAKIFDVSRKMNDSDYALNYLKLSKKKAPKDVTDQQEKQEEKEKEDLKKSSAKKIVSDAYSFKPNSFNSTTGNSLKPSFKFSYNFLKSVIASGKINSKSSGYYISLVNADEYITDADGVDREDRKSVIQIVTDKNGNPVYFDELYNKTTRELGRLVFFRLRGDTSDFIEAKKGLQSDSELQYTLSEPNIDKINEDLREQYKFIQEKKKYVSDEPGRKIVQEITGGSYGFLKFHPKNSEPQDLALAVDLSDGSIEVVPTMINGVMKQRYYFYRNDYTRNIPFATKSVESLGDEFIKNAARVILGMYTKGDDIVNIVDENGNESNENMLRYRKDFLYTFFGNNRSIKIDKNGYVYIGDKKEATLVSDDVDEAIEEIVSALKFKGNQKHSINVSDAVLDSVPFFKVLSNGLLALDSKGLTDKGYRQFIQKNARTTAIFDESTGIFTEENGYFTLRTPVDQVNKIKSSQIISPEVVPSEKTKEIGVDKLKKLSEDIAPIEENTADTFDEALDQEDINEQAKKLAQEYLEAMTDGKFSAEEKAILDTVGLPVTTEQSFNRFSDRNNVTPQIRRVYFKDKGMPIDLIAMYSSDDSGLQVTTDDVVNFILAWPDGKINGVSESAREIAIEFKNLTGKNLTTTVANALLRTKTVKDKNKSAEKLISEIYNALSSKVFDESGNIDFSKLFDVIMSDKDFFVSFPLDLTEKEYKTLKNYVQFEKFKAELYGEGETDSETPTDTEETEQVKVSEDSGLSSLLDESDNDLEDKVEKKDKPKDKPKTDTWEKLKAQADLDEKITSEQEAEALRWWNSDENVLKNFISYREAFDTINPENPNSLATFFGSGITLWQGSNRTELYHEAWHAFTQRLLTKEERDALYDEVKKMPGSFVDFKGKTISFSDPLITNKQIEEYLAEDFRKYMLRGGKGVTTKNTPIKNSVFQTILDILKILFGFALTENASNVQANFNLNEYYERLRTGKNIRTTPLGLDASFEPMQKINPVSKQSQNVSDNMSYSDAMQIVDSIDSFFSNFEDNQNLLNNNSEYTARIFSDPVQRANAYNAFLLDVVEKFKAIVPERKATDKNDPSYENLVRKEIIYKFIIQNFSVGSTTGVGNVTPEDIQKTKESDLGVIAYHMRKSNYLTFEDRYLVDDPDEKKLNDRDGYGHKAGNEVSMKELAENEVLYIIRSLFEYKDGEKVKNELGYYKLADFDSSWNKIQRALEGAVDIADQYDRLEELAYDDPMFAQLISKLGNPNRYSNAEFNNIDKKDSPELDNILLLNNLWTNFSNALGGVRIPLVQLTLNLIKNREGGVSDLEIKPGKAQANTDKVARDFEANFGNSIILGSRRKFINSRPDVMSVDDLKKSSGNTLNIDNVVEEFGDDYMYNPIPFLTALGMDVPDVPGMRQELKTNLKIFPQSLMEKLKAFSEENKRNPNNPIVIRSIKDLISFKYKGKNEDTTYKTFLTSLIKYSDKYGDTMVSTASGKARWELSLKSTVSQMISSWNRAYDFDDLISEGKMSHLDPSRNPFIKQLLITEDTFGENLTTRTKRKTRSGREKKSEIELLNSAGVALLMDGVGSGIFSDSAEADEITQILQNFFSYVIYGVSEGTRHADKATAYWYRVKFSDGRLHYIPMEDFAAYSSITDDAFDDSFSTLGMDKAVNQMMKYLSSEVERIYKLSVLEDPSGKALVGDSTYKEVGSKFHVFEDILPEEVLKEIKSKYLSNADDFYEELNSNKNLYDKVRRGINNYFASQVEKFREDLTGLNVFGSDVLFNPLKEKVLADGASQKLVSDPDTYNSHIIQSILTGYVINDWIQKYETTALFYGDPALYNHLKEDFHKRNASVASTGTIPRSDFGMNELLDKVFKRKYSSSEWFKVSGLTAADKKRTDKMTSAVFDDPIMDSVSYEKYVKAAISNEKKRLGKNTLTKEEEDAVKDTFSSYLGMKVSDAQGFITFDAYRDLLIRLGKWSPLQEKMYNDILDGKDLSFEKINRFFPVKKMQYSGPLAGNSLPLFGFHKFSLVPLIPTVIAGTNLEDLHNKMVSQNIDYATFVTGSKVSTITADGKADTFYDKNGEPAFTKDSFVFTPNEIFLDYFKDQLEVADEYKSKSIFSTQLRKLIEIGLMENGVPIDFNPSIKNKQERLYRWEELTDEQRLNYKPDSFYKKLKDYEGFIENLVEFNKRALIKESGISMDGSKITLSQKFLDFVKQELTRQDLAEHEIDFIRLDPTTNELIYDLSYHPSADKIERLLSAMVYKRLVRQKINGEPLVQVSGVGFEPKGKLRKPTKAELLEYNATNNLPTYKQNYINFDDIYGNFTPKELKEKYNDLKSLKTQVNKWTDRNRNKYVLELQYLKDRIEGRVPEVTEVVDPTSACKVKISLQGDFKNLLRHADVVKLSKEKDISRLDALNILIKDEEWLDKGDNRKMITIAGARIPVQGHNSMEFAEVYEFLPEYSGNIIILPAEVVAKSGSDFDIDKLTMMFPSIVSNSKGAFIVKYNRKDENNYEQNKGLLEAEYTKKDAVIEKIKALSNKEIKESISNAKRIKKDLKDEMVISDLMRDKELGDIYYTAILETNDQLSELFLDLKNNTEEVNKIVKEELIPIIDKIDDLKIKIASGTSKGIENDLLFSVTDILSVPENFTSLVTPNSTDLVQSLAKKYSKYVRDYNQYDTVSDGESYTYTDKKGKTKNRISATRIFELGYNRYKQVSNNIGKKTLGIGAVDNTYNSVFNRIGFYLNPTFTSHYVAEGFGKKKTYKPVTSEQIIRMPHNQTMVSGMPAISLGDLYDVDNKNNISNIISQMINGWVDVAKDSWIFDIQGNQEVGPTLLFLIQAGVPLEQAVAFASQPVIRDYVNKQRYNKSTFSIALGGSLSKAKLYRASARIDMIKQLGLTKNAISVKDLKKIVYGALIPKILGQAGNQNIEDPSKNVFSLKQLDKRIMSNDMTEEEKKHMDAMVLLHFFELEDMSAATTQIKLSMNFDTSRTSSLQEAREKLAASYDIETNDRIPSTVRSQIEENSPIGSFNIQPFMISLLQKLFKFRDSSELREFMKDYINNIDFYRVFPGAFKDKRQFLQTYINDLSSFLFQQGIYNEAFDPRENYKGATVEETSDLDRGVFVKKVDGKYVMYVDFKKLDLDFKTKAYSKKNDFMLAKVETSHFLHGNPEVAKNLYYKFVYERESLRYMVPFSKYKETVFFKNEYNSLKNRERKDKAESPEVYKQRIAHMAYENFLRDTALMNKLNISYMMTGNNGYASQISAVQALVPYIRDKYKVLSSLRFKKNQANKNLRFNEFIFTPDLVNMYYEDIENLANLNVPKSSNSLENQIITNLFAKFHIFSLLQSGQDTRGVYSLGKIANPNKVAELLSYYGEKFMDMAEENTDFALETLLDDYTVLFKRQYSPTSFGADDEYAELVPIKKRAKNYYSKPKLKKSKSGNLLELEDESESFISVSTQNPNMQEYNLFLEDSYEDVVEKLKKWVEESPENEVMVYSTSLQNYSKTEKGSNSNKKIFNSTMIRDLIEEGVLPANKFFGITTKSRGFTRSKSDFIIIETEDQINSFNEMIDSEINELVSMVNDPVNPKVLIFNTDGYGLSLLGYGKSETQNQDNKILVNAPAEKTYMYLSQKLYDNFGYINPMFSPQEEESDEEEIPVKITNEEVRDIIYECFYT